MPAVQECRDKLSKNRCNSSWTTAVEKASPPAVRESGEAKNRGE